MDIKKVLRQFIFSEKAIPEVPGEASHQQGFGAGHCEVRGPQTKLYIRHQSPDPPADVPG